MIVDTGSTHTSDTKAKIISAMVTASPRNKISTIETWEVYLLGLTIVIGGQIIAWNIALSAGFWHFFFSTVLIGTAYMCLILCLAEMTSVLPFAGGAYGFARLALGPMQGYLIGCCEAIEYILYVASSFVTLGDMVSLLTGWPHEYEPLYWFLFYVISLSLQIFRPRLHWTFSNIVASVSLLLIIVYLLGCGAVDANFVNNAVGKESVLDFKRSMRSDFMRYLPLATWFYVGIEAVPLCGGDAKNAKRSVPIGMVAGMLTLLVTSFGLLFAVASVQPGVPSISTALVPLNFGYQRMFNISERQATILALPGTFATAYGFIYAYGQQVFAMSRSGLLPKFLSKTYGKEGAPSSALLACSLCGFVLLLVGRYLWTDLLHYFYNISILGSFLVYISLLRCFTIFRSRYSRLERNFTNIFGVTSAVVGAVIYALALVGVAFFQDDDYVSLIAFTGLLFLVLLYYQLVAKKHQFFSKEEQAVMLVAYIINANTRHHSRSATAKRTKQQLSSYQARTSSVDNNGRLTKHGQNSSESAGSMSFMISRRKVSSGHSSGQQPSNTDDDGRDVDAEGPEEDPKSHNTVGMFLAASSDTANADSHLDAKPEAEPRTSPIKQRLENGLSPSLSTELGSSMSAHEAALLARGSSVIGNVPTGSASPGRPFVNTDGAFVPSINPSPAANSTPSNSVHSTSVRPKKTRRSFLTQSISNLASLTSNIAKIFPVDADEDQMFATHLLPAVDQLDPTILAEMEEPSAKAKTDVLAELGAAPRAKTTSRTFHWQNGGLGLSMPFRKSRDNYDHPDIASLSVESLQ